MASWKYLKQSPPKEDCNICVRIGLDYETFQFKRNSEDDWILIKNSMPIDSNRIPGYTLYINLDKIK